METCSPTLDRILSEVPPALLFHYGSAVSLIGILENKEVWASNLLYVNDAKETLHAVEYAQLAVSNRLMRMDRDSAGTEEEKGAMAELGNSAGSAARRVYAFSLSEKRDLLSQWRAYCPPGGGYSIGFPSSQLLKMASKQGFILSRCVYDHATQYAIAEELVSAFFGRYRARVAGGENPKTAQKAVAWEFAQHLGTVGPILKHPSFEEEKEWRLISGMIDERAPQIGFRPTTVGVVPFFRFQLVDAEDPDLVRTGEPGHFTVVVGPTSNPGSAMTAVQFLIQKHLPGAAFGPSDSPYRVSPL